MRSVLRVCARRPCTFSSPAYTRVAQHTIRFRSNNSSSPPAAGPEAPPFHGYLVDALDAPLHTIAPATATTPAAPPPDNPPTTPEEEKLAKARVVFGSRLAGPAERKREIEKASVVVGGVMVPPRPEEPDNCCMSGCVNCVWDVYRDELEEWAAKSVEAKAKLASQRREGTEGGSMGTASSVDEDGGGSEGNWSAGVEGEDLFEGIPVGIREFMRTEKKLKDRHRREGSTGG